MRNYAKLDLSGIIKYQKNMLFDNSKTLITILDEIEAARKDPSIQGLIINTANMSANKSIEWEIREKLKEFKSSGKTIYIFVERTNLDGYHRHLHDGRLRLWTQLL
jgi:hypothetical protein